MSVLILKNAVLEGAGTMADYFREQSIPCTVVELERGEAPPPPDDFGALIVLGGPMGVYEMDRYPHLAVAARLASSQLYENQAFRYGSRVYAFQFHIEANRDILGLWFPGDKGILDEAENMYEEYTGRAVNFYRAFFANLKCPPKHEVCQRT